MKFIDMIFDVFVSQCYVHTDTEAPVVAGLNLGTETAGYTVKH